jgi:hypothetical protein
MHQIPFISDDCLDLALTHLTMVEGLTKYPSKLVPIGFGLPPGDVEGPSSAPITSSLLHLISHSFAPFP